MPIPAIAKITVNTENGFLNAMKTGTTLTVNMDKTMTVKI
ncbi:hypothetical protein SAMN06264346_107174 [Chryseobacterium profundimaris]|uniref:Uncharacterized protein n=1 Tax=Chryseobacterium profundimaris TaxID=1387275 RepID=A0ABY1P158_9FLAO|nr:hypothetical protein SAMN06264346_107174 [Chryseobacterium profundimaris]